MAGVPHRVLHFEILYRFYGYFASQVGPKYIITFRNSFYRSMYAVIIIFFFYWLFERNYENKVSTASNFVWLVQFEWNIRVNWRPQYSVIGFRRFRFIKRCYLPYEWWRAKVGTYIIGGVWIKIWVWRFPDFWIS